MNEISRCCRLLGVKHGATLGEVGKAYRDLVQVWHPDRFSNNERLQAKAQDQLREINIAYDYLVAHAFQDGVLIEAGADAVAGSPPPEGPVTAGPEAGWAAEERETPAKTRPRSLFWTVCAGVMAVVVAGVYFLYPRFHGRAGSPIPEPPASGTVSVPNPPQVAIEPVAVAATNVNPRPGDLYPFAEDVRATLESHVWLESTQLLSPPFAIKAKLSLVDLSEVRLHYALSAVTFNWSESPKTLRVDNPRTGSVTSVPDQGILPPNPAQELVWNISTNRMTVSVNGQIRHQGDGDFSGVKGYPGISLFKDPAMLESFVIETPEPPGNSPPPTRGHGPIEGDILSSLAPESGVQVSNGPDGMSLRSEVYDGNRLMSPQTFQPPFVITTRAKTESFDLRLYYGEGILIFNWRDNPGEMRVHDPRSGLQIAVPGKGVISPNEWHTFIWEIEKTGMKVYVDGQLRFQNLRREYGDLNAKVGIGPAGDRITVDYFKVDKK